MTPDHGTPDPRDFPTPESRKAALEEWRNGLARLDTFRHLTNHDLSVIRLALEDRLTHLLDTIQFPVDDPIVQAVRDCIDRLTKS